MTKFCISVGIQDLPCVPCVQLLVMIG